MTNDKRRIYFELEKGQNRAAFKRQFLSAKTAILPGLSQSGQSLTIPMDGAILVLLNAAG
jgi:hypothetical protein